MPEQNKIVLYTTESGNVSVDVYFENETFWLTQKSMAELFDCTADNISLHLKNIYAENELNVHSTAEKFSVVRREGERDVRREVTFYNLDAIIAVGYRVNSKSATRFRQWATQTLKEYIIKGFVLNDDMMKNGRPFGRDYFDELLERIKEIRASERRFYQKITDIYAECSYDYDPQSANASKENMGLTTWKNAPDGKILRTDVTVSKNYLSQKEMSGLNDIVTMYLDYAENQAKRERLMSMDDWAKKLDAFLQFNEYELLHHKGKVERKVADALAQQEYEKFRVIQDKQYISDFDRATKKILKK